jgi:hypothetical protein
VRRDPRLHRRINDLERQLAVQVDSHERRLSAIEEERRNIGAGAGEPLPLQR